jgi:alanine racemase
VGVGLYGLWPSSAVRGALPDEALAPVLSWKSRLAQVKTVPAGGAVGYDLTYRAEGDRQVGVVPVGYYDGFDRGLSNRGQVLVRGRRVPVVGRVAMNMFMVDVTHTGALEGDEVVLLGAHGEESIGAEEMASWVDTIAYEVVARLGPRIPRSLV